MIIKSKSNFFLKKSFFNESIAFLILFLGSVLILNTFLLLPIKMPWDAYYHFSRTNNLYENFFQTLYPQNFYTLGQIGTVTNVFYPSMNMQLLVNLIPRFTNNALYVYKAFILISFFMSSVVSYIVLHFKLGSKKVIAILLSLLWASFIFTTTQGGDSLGLISLPFLCYGLESINQKKGYIFLSMGIILGLYGHLITALLTVLSVIIYYIATCFIKNERVSATKNIIKAGLISILGSASTILPILIISKSNSIQTPTVNIKTFKTWLLSLDFFSSPTYIIIAVFIGIALATTKRVSRGQLVALFIAILGTTAFCWPSFTSSSSLTAIQMPIRIFNFGLFLLVFFTILNLAKKKYSIQGTKLLAFAAIPVVLTVMFTIHNNLSPTIDEDGKEKVTSNYDLTQYVNEGHDGYSINDLDAFDYSTVKNPSIWNLMNYSDYVPQQILRNYKAAMLSDDTNGKNIAQHLAVTSDNKKIKTKNYHATSSKISFSLKKATNNETVKLPVLGYKNTNVKVYINGKIVKHTIQDGQLSVNKSIWTTDIITIKQFVPFWEIIAFIMSISAWFILFLCYRSSKNS